MELSRIICIRRQMAEATRRRRAVLLKLVVVASNRLYQTVQTIPIASADDLERSNWSTERSTR